MKKLIIMMALILLAVFLSSGPALAHDRHSRGHGHFGVFIAPPPIWIGPPAIHRGYYPPPYQYPPNYYEPNRVWVPGHWEERWGPYGWEKVWIPGYWQYNP